MTIWYQGGGVRLLGISTLHRLNSLVFTERTRRAEPSPAETSSTHWIRQSDRYRHDISVRDPDLRDDIRHPLSHIQPAAVGSEGKMLLRVHSVGDLDDVGESMWRGRRAAQIPERCSEQCDNGCRRNGGHASSLRMLRLSPTVVILAAPLSFGTASLAI